MTDLTDRMRTCAAFILATKEALTGTDAVVGDAADLLIEASNLLEAAEPPPVPMEIIPPVAKRMEQTVHGTWVAPGAPLPTPTHGGTVSPRACPQCDSRAMKQVRRAGTRLALVCPACSHVWPYKARTT